MEYFQRFLKKSFQLNLGNSSLSFELIFFLSFFLSFVGISKLNITLDIANLEDQSFQSVNDLKEMKKNFGNYESLDLYISRLDSKPLTQADVCLIGSWVNLQKKNYKTTSLFDLRYPSFDDGKLWYQLYSKKINCQDSVNSPEIFKNEIWNKYFYLKNGKDISIQMSLSLDDIKQNKVDLIQDSFKKYLGSKLKYKMYGQSSIKHYFFKALKRDNFINISLVLFVLLFFYVAFNSFKIGLLAIGSVLLSTIFVLGLMGFLGFHITLINNCLFIMLTLAVIQDIVFIFTDYYDGNLTLRKTLNKMIVPCFYTSLTTFIGFMTLIVSPVKHIREFGIEIAIGTMIEWGLLFYVFPRFITKDWEKFKFKKINLLNWVPSKKFNLLALVLFLASAFYIKDLKIEDKLSKNFATDHPHTQSIKYVKETRQWETQVSLIFNDGSDPAKINSHVRLLKGVSDLMSIDEIKQSLTVGLPDFVKSRVWEDFDSLDFAKRLKQNGLKNEIVFLKSNDLNFLDSINLELKKICAEYCKVVGHPIVYLEFMEKVISDLRDSLFICATIILLVLYILFYKEKTINFVKLAFSMFWGPIVLLGGLSISHTPLQLTNSMAITVLLGLAGDNAIHYYFASEGKGLDVGIEKRAMGSWLMSSFLILGCTPFLFMTYIPMQRMGMILMIGFALSFVGDYFLIKK